MPPDPPLRPSSRIARSFWPAFVFVALGLLVAVGGAAVYGCLPPIGMGTEPRGLAAEDAPEPFDTDAFNFVVIGDWGRNGLFNQRTVGRTMGGWAARINSRFVISTGDNFYTSGVQSVTDTKWNRSFENIYTASALQRPWYVVLGNHDWLGNAQAQIEYSATSTRWRMPDYYYSAEMSVDDTTEVLFAFLDTMPLVELPERASRYPGSDVWNAERQLAWLDSTLAASKADWKIVVGHHPILNSPGKYGDNETLIRDLEPILERHGVHIYFCGHEHSLQHLRREGGSVDYFISGAGSLTRAIGAGENTIFARRVPGFMAVSLTADQMYVQVIGETGNVFYFTNVPRLEGDPSTPVRPDVPLVSADDTVSASPAEATPEEEEGALQPSGAGVLE